LNSKPIKRVLIDLYKTKDLYSGLGQFSINYATELVKAGSEFDFSFLVPRNFNNETIKGRTITASAFRRYIPDLNKGFDLWHSLDQFPSFFPNRETTQILTIHDLNFLTEKNKEKGLEYLDRLQKNLDKASVITTISNYTRKHIEENLRVKGKPIYTIYNGVRIAEGQGVKPAFINNEPFFFSLSVFKAAKNFEVLLPVMRNFKHHKLILAGNNETAYGAAIREKITDLGLKSRVIMPGKISEEEKTWLYQNCDGFLFPSKAEGFGLPVIEAMMFGKPVFLSRYTSLPEIGGDQAFYFDSFDTEHMADIITNGIDRYKTDQPRMEKHIKDHAFKFSWNNSARNYLDLYREILGT
jgi:glycosyltransferase involved in cell wall biosynthesis